MLFTKRINRAIELASDLHRNQLRKTSPVPYICHPFAVGLILSAHTDDEDVIIAGLFHDILEDVAEYSEEQMRNEFGNRVTNIVLEVSEKKDPRNKDEDKKKTWQGRKEGYLDHLRVATDEALLVCAADKVHNIMTLTEALKNQGRAVWEKFNSPKENRIWFWKEVVSVLTNRLGDAPIVDQLQKVFSEFEVLA